jgi:hypothetical protein
VSHPLHTSMGTEKGQRKSFERRGLSEHSIAQTKFEIDKPRCSDMRSVWREDGTARCHRPRWVSHEGAREVGRSSNPTEEDRGKEIDTALLDRPRDVRRVVELVWRRRARGGGEGRKSGEAIGWEDASG